jgi:hypothetical protein
MDKAAGITGGGGTVAAAAPSPDTAAGVATTTPLPPPPPPPSSQRSSSSSSGSSSGLRLSPDLWCVSVRPSGGPKILNRFAERTFLFQPDATLYCANGLSCALYARYRAAGSSGGGGGGSSCCASGGGGGADAGGAATLAAAAAAEHCSRYLHVGEERHAADSDSTLVVNEAGLRVTIPAVRRAWVLLHGPSPELAAATDDSGDGTKQTSTDGPSFDCASMAGASTRKVSA